MIIALNVIGGAVISGCVTALVLYFLSKMGYMPMIIITKLDDKDES